MATRVLIAGGGTGGHLYPGLAVAEVLRQRGAEVLFVGTQNGVESKIVPQHQFDIEYLWLSGFHRRKVLSNLMFPFKLITSLFQSWDIISRFNPKAALGTGGYVCGPILRIAKLRGVPIFLQEQNSFPGVTTRLLARSATRVFLNFQEATKHLPQSINWMHVGNPVRSEFKQIDKTSAVQKWQLNPDLPTLLVFGGSQGAMSINKAVNAKLSDLCKICNLIWSRGFLDTSEPEGWEGPGKLVIKPYIDDMPFAYAASDLAVCRSGAMTLSELQASRLPALLIPYPHAAGDHQRHNAEVFTATGAAEILLHDELNADVIFSRISTLLSDQNKLAEMRKALAEMPVHNAAELIADELIRTADGDA